MFKISLKTFALIAAVFLIAVGVLNFDNKINRYQVVQIDFSDFVNEVENKNVRDVIINGTKIVGHLNNDVLFSTVVPFQDRDLVPKLLQNKVRIKATMPDEDVGSWISFIFSWIPMLLFSVFLFLQLKQFSKGAPRMMDFSKTKAKKTEGKEKTTFKDVAGANEEKKELIEIVEFLKNPKKFQSLGGRMPKGVLLSGPPGTGKTLLARAVAGESNCSFFYISASEFVEMFVGMGASRVRDLFEKAKKSLPAIIFVDEIDAMGRHRGVGLGGGNDEREQTLNEFLVQLDGFAQNKGLIVFAATNRPDVLDKALTRSGRFDRQIYVSTPDLKQRQEILEVHAKKVFLDKNVDLNLIARSTPGFSGADLENLLNESALLAARLDKKAIELTDLENARDKIMMGLERSYVMSDEDKKLTAYHEAGHALIAYYCKHSDPIHKATIVPRGDSLGMVVQFPETDKFSMSKIQLIARVRVLMAGIIAEELVFGKEHVTSGARADIQVATGIAKAMVLEYGMSEVVGMRNYLDNEEVRFGARNSVYHHSQEFSKILDQEINKILDEACQHVKASLKKRLKKLHILADSLLKHETLTGQEIAKILEPGEKK